MKIFTGIVKHTKMAKTAVVYVTLMKSHPVYGKRIKKTKFYSVHDGIGVKPGDKVRFVACHPVSKTKKWKIVELVKEKDGHANKKIDKKRTAKGKKTKK